MKRVRAWLPAVWAASAAAILACTAPVEIAQDAHTRPTLADSSRAWSQVTAGFVHTCGLAGGVAYCWGSNEYGQLGAQTTESCGGRPCSTSAVRVSGDVRFASIDAGWVHNCGVTFDGALYCWGGGAIGGAGYLGDGRVSRAVAPVRVAADSAFAAVTVGDGHTCALTASGMAFCWGVNANGQLGDGTLEDRAVPVAVDSPLRFISLSAGANHTCGVTSSGASYCWGDNRWGQLGSGNAARYQSLPTAVSGGRVFATIAAGWEHTCALSDGGAPFCWGRNDNANQLGDESGIAGRDVPGPVSGGFRFSALYAGALTTCGRTASSELFCWGGNYYGAIGSGGTDPHGMAHPIRADGGPFASASIGQAHTCALATDQRLWCWGDQTLGQF